MSEMPKRRRARPNIDQPPPQLGVIADVLLRGLDRAVESGSPQTLLAGRKDHPISHMFLAPVYDPIFERSFRVVFMIGHMGRPSHDGVYLNNLGWHTMYEAKVWAGIHVCLPTYQIREPKIGGFSRQTWIMSVLTHEWQHLRQDYINEIEDEKWERVGDIWERGQAPSYHERNYEIDAFANQLAWFIRKHYLARYEASQSFEDIEPLTEDTIARYAHWVLGPKMAIPAVIERTKVYLRGEGLLVDEWKHVSVDE